MLTPRYSFHAVLSPRRRPVSPAQTRSCSGRRGCLGRPRSEDGAVQMSERPQGPGALVPLPSWRHVAGPSWLPERQALSVPEERSVMPACALGQETRPSPVAVVETTGRKLGCAEQQRVAWLSLLPGHPGDRLSRSPGPGIVSDDKR